MEYGVQRRVDSVYLHQKSSGMKTAENPLFQLEGIVHFGALTKTLQRETDRLTPMLLQPRLAQNVNCKRCIGLILIRQRLCKIL
jgi:hypothetical protein